LQLPELLAQVFDHLETQGPKHLLAAVRVNSLWADQATNILWQHPPYTALAALANDARRQYYARKVRALTLANPATDAGSLNAASSCLARVPLPRLQQLELVADAVLLDESGLATLSNLLVPVPPLREDDNEDNGSGRRGIVNAVSSQLARFRYHGRALWLMDVLELLRVAGAPLTELTLDCTAAGRGSITPDPVLFLGMLEALSSSGRLTSALFKGSAAHAVALPALVYLARLPDLASLTIDRCVRKAEVHDMLTGATTLAGRRSGAPILSVFPSLQRLTLGIESAAVPLLLPHLTGLRHLALQLHDEKPLPDLVLSTVGTTPSMRGLRSLQLLVRADAYASVENWLALMSLTELRALTVAPFRLRSSGRRRPPRYDSMRLRAPTLDDAMLAQLLSAVGRELRELVLWLFAGYLSVGALWSIGASCPLLERLELAGRYNLQELGATGDYRLFPRLRVLRLTGAHMEVYDDTDDEQ
jgi:hypothetical protein